jgi:hypothetical protein
MQCSEQVLLLLLLLPRSQLRSCVMQATLLACATSAMCLSCPSRSLLLLLLLLPPRSSWYLGYLVDV